MNIGNKIKKYRIINNLSQEELANKLYVSRQTLSNWENNKYYPDIKSIVLACNIFNVSIDDFLKEDLEEIKKHVDEIELKKFTIVSYIFAAEMLIMVLSAYPLLKFLKLLGIIIWLIISLISISTAFYIEKIKKIHNIQTYKEILAFFENKELSHDEKNIEFGKRNYQKILAAILSSLIALIVMFIMSYIFK